MRIKRLLLGTLLISCTILSGCFEKPEVTNNSGESAPVEQVGEPIYFENDYTTYGNGTDIVNYKGNIYYIEYGSNDFIDEAIRSPWYYIKADSNNQRYVNVIDSRGIIKNLFKVTGANSFAIVDDRFYIKSASGLLYTVDMKGQNSIELTKGDYVAYDDLNGAVYYVSYNNPNILYKVNTKTMQIETLDFNNPLTSGNSHFVGIREGNLYYAMIDEKTRELSLIQHNISSNEQTEVDKVAIDDFSKEDQIQVVCTNYMGKYSGIAIGNPTGGTMLGYYNRIICTFDLDAKKITKGRTANANEDTWFDDDTLQKELFSELYMLSTLKPLPSIYSLFTEEDRIKFANKYHININDVLGNEGKNSSTTTPDTPKYLIEVEDYTIVGNNIFYKVTASRRNPAGEIGWREAFIRMCSEVYLYNIDAKETKFIYSYINNNFQKVEEKIEEIVISGENYSGELEEAINTIQEDDSKNIDELKDNEMILEIDTSKQWKTEFDVRVEEVGGMIIGKQIEYEGHHKKSEGTLKIKVSKEPGAMLTVYIDGELDSQMRID